MIWNFSIFFNYNCKQISINHWILATDDSKRSSFIYHFILATLFVHRYNLKKKGNIISYSVVVFPTLVLTIVSLNFKRMWFKIKNIELWNRFWISRPEYLLIILIFIAQNDTFVLFHLVNNFQKRFTLLNSQLQVIWK